MDKLVAFLMALLFSIPTSLFAGKRQFAQQVVPSPMATPMTALVATPVPTVTPRPVVIAQITAAQTPKPTETPLSAEQIDTVIQGTVRKVYNGFAIIVYNKAELRVNITKETELRGGFTIGTKLQITHSGEMILGDLPEITALEIEAIPK